MKNYVSPELERNAYNCPYCNAYSEQMWYELQKKHEQGTWNMPGYRVSICRKCDEICFWKMGGEAAPGRMIYPDIHLAPMPASDMPEKVKDIYLEARNVLSYSPRAAAALLRLAIEELVSLLGEKGNLNKSIGNLVKRGLPDKVQKSLDAVRVIGNNAVHPGLISIDDDERIALVLFKLSNIIVEKIISEKALVDEIYDMLPNGAKESIEKRDSKNT